MNLPIDLRPYVVVNLQWLIEHPTSSSTAGLTCYREEVGPDDLFSVFVVFGQTMSQSGFWVQAKIFALVEEMENRLPLVGAKLILTAGLTPVAIAEVASKTNTWSAREASKLPR